MHKTTETQCVSVQAFDKGPWPRMSGRERGKLMSRLADLMEVSVTLLEQSFWNGMGLHT